MASHSNVLFREIHKNAWLRKLPNGERKSGTTLKKGEKVWTVFCVHDDTEPFLELYPDQKVAAAHRPEYSLSLGTALHISPTICPQDDEFEFVITLSSDLLRLTAPSWDVMIDWVDTLCSKLREMHILSPKENVYSRNPEARPALLPTRDPNSPLPLPPSGSSSAMPGLEVFQQNELRNNPDSCSRNYLEHEAVRNLTIFNSSQSTFNQDRARNVNRTETPDLRENVTVIQVSTESSLNSSNSNVFDFTHMWMSVNQEELPTPPSESACSHLANRTRLHPPFLDNSVVVTNIPQHQCEQNTERNAEVNDDSLYEHVFLTIPTRTVGQCTMQLSAERGTCLFRSDNLRIDMDLTAGQTYRNERESAEQRTHLRNPLLQPPPQPFSREVSTEAIHRMTLREQQVLQLRKEMLHSGGVRLQLRRRDCIGTIALIDFFSAIWIAGWKQKDHPVLYNALHIGDQLVSVAGIVVQSAEDAQRLIRVTPSLYIELIIRRVPCGRVYALQRESEGQDLGIIQEGRTAGIKEIVAGSIAAVGGLPSHIPTLDGLSLTNCVLTEINGRPLNLFFKDNEVRDRLNAVGLDISLLVQPLDLIKQLKKQLKSMRNYKDYIVQ